MRRIQLVVLAAALILAAPASAAGPVPPLGHQGRWITDAHGRVVFIHAVNMVYKQPPYYPRAVGFGADDARFLHRHGFNGVRLGVIYKGVEPKPGRYDDGYIASVAKSERTLARHGVFSLIDFHQDLYNEKFQGEGWPNWAVQDDGLPNPDNGFPTNYFSNPALIRAFDHFWGNDPGPAGIGLVRRYANAWRHAASRFRSAGHVLGYDLMNEPWPGSPWATCAQPAGCPVFDTGPLAAMTRTTTRAIRRVDRTHLVWQEPNVLFNFGAETHLPRIGAKSGFSFHDYCLDDSAPSCPANEAQVFDHADAQAAKTNRALMLTEFGATNDRPRIEHIVDLADQHMVSWMWWAYCGCDDPTTSGPGNLQAIVKDPARPPRGSNVLHHKLALLDRPYPQAIAGTPTSFGYDPKANTLNLSYRTKAPDGGRLGRKRMTRVYVPRSHYPEGYAVDVRGARAIYTTRARYLLLKRNAGAQRVRLVISPRD